MYEAGNALRRNVALLCCSFQSFLKIFLIPKAFAVLLLHWCSQTKFLCAVPVGELVGTAAGTAKENVIVCTARHFINSSKEGVYVGIFS